MLIDEDEYRAWDGVELARLVRAGEVSATDLTETALGLLEARSDLNALAYRVDPVGAAGDRRGVRRGAVRRQGAAGLARVAVDDGLAPAGEQPGAGPVALRRATAGRRADRSGLDHELRVRVAGQHRDGIARHHEKPLAGRGFRWGIVGWFGGAGGCRRGADGSWQ